MAGPIRVEVIQAWPRRHQAVSVDLGEGATVADAIAAARFAPGGHVGVAIHGEATTTEQILRDGDRVELLRALKMDPMEARRRRAGK